mmetsp:Transcript_13328/g.13818  ORF Transcript_13328/g.13818 Transcript_13328/m.13818 type:complete len:202 (+) Transcript_13328:31-636(+)
MSLLIKLEVNIYIKIILHASKYPSLPIIGLLLGREENNNNISISNIFPVLHSSPAGPLFDISLLSASEIFPDTKVVGLYFGNDRIDSDAWPHYIEKLVKGIKDINGTCLTFQIKNSLLENTDRLCLTCTQGSRGGQLEIQPNNLTPVFVNKILDDLLAENYHRRFQDFEDHSDSTHQPEGSDFRNSLIDSVVNEYLAKNLK